MFPSKAGRRVPHSRDPRGGYGSIASQRSVGARPGAGAGPGAGARPGAGVKPVVGAVGSRQAARSLTCPALRQ